MALQLTSPQLTADTPEGPEITAIIDAFWEHAQDYYRHPDGTPNSRLPPLPARGRRTSQLR